MSKYDFQIDLSLDTSTGLLLSKIKPGTAVLEFGPAEGRMTRYMREELHCKVYIVEYDREAFESAVRYAEDGLCDDILRFAWVERFKDIRFDSVLFADVLEHLTDPAAAVQAAAKLLTDAGEILVSIPNVTHNDILLKAMSEHFDYSNVGLLDSTHVHFWGRENIQPFAEECGLFLSWLTGTPCRTGFTEQFGGCLPEADPALQNSLRQRSCGEIYQFVFSMKKAKSAEVILDFPKPSIESRLYLDTGRDFNAEEMIVFSAPQTAVGEYQAKYVLKNTDGLRRLRFDPVEQQSCILREISLKQGGRELRISYPKGVPGKNGLLLDSPDPMVIADVAGTGESVTVEARILLPGAGYEAVLQNMLTAVHGEKVSLAAVNQQYVDQVTALTQSVRAVTQLSQSLEQANRELTSQNQALEETGRELISRNQELTSQNQALEETGRELISRNQELEASVQELKTWKEQMQPRLEELGALQREHQSLQGEFAAVYVLANRKDMELIRAEARRAALEKNITALETRNVDLETRNVDLETRNVDLETRNVDLETHNADLEKQLLDKRNHVQALEAALAYHCMEEERYKNMKGARLQMLVVRILRGIKRRLKRLLGKDSE